MSGNLVVAGNEIGNKDLFFPMDVTALQLHFIHFLQVAEQEPRGSSRGLEENVDLFGVCQCYLELFRAIWRHLKQC